MTDDPVEMIIEAALEMRGIRFDRHHAAGLDFYLPDYDTHIECKQFYAARIAEQMARVQNVIVIQGTKAAWAFGKLITGENG